MDTPEIIVAVYRGDETERVTVSADRVEWDTDGSARLYAGDTEIATFPDALYAVKADKLED
jgi:L-asparaginase II